MADKLKNQLSDEDKKKKERQEQIDFAAATLAADKKADEEERGVFGGLRNWLTSGKPTSNTGGNLYTKDLSSSNPTKPGGKEGVYDPFSDEKIGVESADQERIPGQKPLQQHPKKEDTKPKTISQTLAKPTPIQATQAVPEAKELSLEEQIQQSRDELTRIYKENRDRKDWAEVAELFANALIKYAAAREGLKKNVDLSGVKGQTTDWDKKRAQDLEELKMGLSDLKDKEQRLWGKKEKEEDRAWRAEEAQKERDWRATQASLNRKMRSQLSENKGSIDPKHLASMTKQYQMAYRREAKKDIENATKGLTGDFKKGAAEDAVYSLMNMAPDLYPEEKRIKILNAISVDDTFWWGDTDRQITKDVVSKLQKDILDHLSSADRAKKDVLEAYGMAGAQDLDMSKPEKPVSSTPSATPPPSASQRSAAPKEYDSREALLEAYGTLGENEVIVRNNKTGKVYVARPSNNAPKP